jgi:hypothetical protein
LQREYALRDKPLKPVAKDAHDHWQQVRALVEAAWAARGGSKLSVPIAFEEQATIALAQSSAVKLALSASYVG